MTVKNAGVKGQCSIGFTTEGFKMCRQPGYVFVCLCLAKQTFDIQIIMVYTPCPDEAAKHLMYHLQKLWVFPNRLIALLFLFFVFCMYTYCFQRIFNPCLSFSLNCNCHMYHIIYTFKTTNVFCDEKYYRNPCFWVSLKGTKPKWKKKKLMEGEIICKSLNKTRMVIQAIVELRYIKMNTWNSTGFIWKFS